MQILGTGMSAKMWEVTVEHARTCVIDDTRSFYCSQISQLDIDEPSDQQDDSYFSDSYFSDRTCIFVEDELKWLPSSDTTCIFVENELKWLLKFLN